MTTSASLTLERVGKGFGSVAAVDGVSVEVAVGEHLALVGPSGCGKSTLLQLVAGLLEPERGVVRIGGATVAGAGRWVPPDARSATMVFQDHALFPHLTVSGNVAFGLGRHTRSEREELLQETLSLVGLRELSERFPHELSSGQQQRVALARALAPSPQLVLLDEPFSNLDRALRDELRVETKALLRQSGATAVLVTHDQGEAMAFGDRLAVMRAGRVEQVGSAHGVFHQPDNRFVARALGEATFLPLGRDPSSGLVTEAGPVEAPPGIEGDDLSVMARPHEVDLDVDRSGPATVAGAEFRGGSVLYELRLPSGVALSSLQPHTRRLELGTRVRPRLVHGHLPAIFRGEQRAWPGTQDLRSS